MEKYKLYNGKVELIYEDNKHTYMVGDSIIPGVTGVVGVIDKPALKYWTVKLMAEHLEKNWEAGKSYDEIQIKKIIQDGKSKHRQRLSDAADIGTMAHDWIEKYIKGEDPKELVNLEAKSACDAFLDWVDKNNVRFISTEKKIYSKKYKYAGTMDFEAEIDGKKVIGDLKTSSGIWNEAILQTAAYQQARQEETGEKYDHRIIVRLGKFLVEGKPDFEVKELHDFNKDIKGFLGALLLSNRIKVLDQEKKNATS